MALPNLACDEVLDANFDDVTDRCGADGAGRINGGGACEGPNLRLTALYRHTCAILHDDAVWCWGENAYGEVGDATHDFRPNPVRVAVPPAAQITAGEGHGCALTRDGDVYCWGNNAAGQCGVDPSPLDAALPPTRVEALAGLKIDALSAGRAHTCALSGEEVYCWGFNQEKQCGESPDTEIVVAPRKVAGLDHVLELQSIKAHNCALRSVEPRMVCWGRNERGQLGPAAQGVLMSPLPVPLVLPGGVIAVTFGLSFDSTYATGSDGRVYAWGYNARGQLGIGSQEPIVTEPSPVLFEEAKGLVAVDYAMRTFRSDGSHQCTEVSTADSHHGARFLCWGGDDAGELGRGELTTQGEIFDVAQAALAIPNSVRELVFGEDHGCAVDEQHRIVCWGTGGHVGDGRLPEAPGKMIVPPQLSAEPVQWLPESR